MRGITSALLLAGMLAMNALNPAKAGEGDGKKLDEFDRMRLRWKITMTGGGDYDPRDPRVAAKLKLIAETARENWITMRKEANRTHLWDGWTTEKLNSGAIWRSYRRLIEMGVAYHAKGSALKGNKQLLKDTIDGLEWVHTNWYNEKSRNRGWVHFEIVLLKYLSDATVLMYDELTPAQRKKYLDTVERWSPSMLRFNNRKPETGANRIGKAKGIVIGGIAARKRKRVLLGRDALDEVLPYVASGEGFFSDGSFVFHRAHPYNGGYGSSLLVQMGDIMYMLSGTSLDIKNPRVKNMYERVHEAYQPIMWRGCVMDMFRGRTTSFHSKTAASYGGAVIGGTIRMAQAAEAAGRKEDALAYKRMLKHWVAADTFRDVRDSLSLDKFLYLERVMKDKKIKPRGDLVRYKQYHNMDRTVHFRPGWALGISMHSTRIYNYESLRGRQNPRGWHTGDGMTYLYNADLSQFAGSFWGTVNRHRLPGTTVSVGANPPENLKGLESWVGGVEWEKLYGATGMWHRPPRQKFSARKSWFCFDGEVVALGSGITCSDNRVVETTVENRRLTRKGKDNLLTVDGAAKPGRAGWSEDLKKVSWAHIQGNVRGSDVGYYFPSGADVKALRETRRGKWVDVNPMYATKDELSDTFLTLWLDHGRKPKNASYAYALLPNRSAADAKAYAADPEVEIVAHSARVHAVREKKLGLLAANFWTPGPNKAGELTCKGKAAVMLGEAKKGELVICVADPTHLGDRVEIEIGRKARKVLTRDREIKVERLSPTIKLSVNVKKRRGKTFSIRLSTAP